METSITFRWGTICTPPEADSKTTADHSAATSCFFSTSTTFCAVKRFIYQPKKRKAPGEQPVEAD